MAKYLALLWLFLGFPAALAANGVALSILIQRAWLERQLRALALLAILIATQWLIFFLSLRMLPGQASSDAGLAVISLLMTLAVAVIAPVLRWSTLRTSTRTHADKKKPRP